MLGCKAGIGLENRPQVKAGNSPAINGMNKIEFEEIGDDLKIAFIAETGKNDGRRCGIFWLGGFMSDMTGTKAEALADLARLNARSCLRFDYSGHGASGGILTEGTISDWLAQAVHMFKRHTRGPQIVVGSSMGGWLAMLMTKALGEDANRMAGLVLIAPAGDMTERLMWDEFDPSAREAILREGMWLRPSAYGDPYPITRRLIEDGRKHLILHSQLAVACPVRILQGDVDPDVPPAHAMRVFEAIVGEDVAITLVKDGDHRLSTARDIGLLKRVVLELAEGAD
jgi:pimeloyl-ACP methyl ester carboxylesterase